MFKYKLEIFTSMDNEIDFHVDDSLRLSVHGGHKYHGRKDFRDFLEKHGLINYISVQKVKGSIIGYVSSCIIYIII